jgi:hypothetical protein
MRDLEENAERPTPNAVKKTGQAAQCLMKIHSVKIPEL